MDCALLLAIGRGRLGRGARGLLWPLQPQHQLDQLFAAQPFKVAAAHLTRESAKSVPRKGVGNYPAEVREQIVALALEEPELSLRELAVRSTDERRSFVSEATVYCLLKAQDLITGSASIVVKAADEFHDKITAPNQLWQTVARRSK